MDQQDFEERLDASEHVIEWRKISLTDECEKYEIETVFRIYRPEHDVFDGVTIDWIEISYAPKSAVPTMEDRRGWLARLIVPEREWPALKFEVELP